jgi:hypothetical protein
MLKMYISETRSCSLSIKSFKKLSQTVAKGFPGNAFTLRKCILRPENAFMPEKCFHARKTPSVPKQKTHCTPERLLGVIVTLRFIRDSLVVTLRFIRDSLVVTLRFIRDSLVVTLLFIRVTLQFLLCETKLMRFVHAIFTRGRPLRCRLAIYAWLEISSDILSAVWIG